MADSVPFAVKVYFEEERPSDTSQAVDSAGPVKPGVTIVAVAGEVDLSAVPALRQRLTEVISPARGEVVVDLRAVDFMDASGVGALVRAAGEAARFGVRFRVRAPSPAVTRVLSLARLDGILDLDSESEEET
jgi:anti-anti-sigma factor